MNNLSVLVCDDDEYFIPLLKKYIDETLGKVFRLKYSMYIDSSKVIEENQTFQIAFIDIDMPDIDGFLLSKFIKMKVDTRVVYVSSKHELVFESFNYNAYDFIRKDDLDMIYMKSKRWIQDLTPVRFYFRDKFGDQNIEVRSILYIYKHNNYSYIVTSENIYKTRNKINDIYNLLNKQVPSFVLPNRSTIININYIKDIRYPILKLLNNEVFTVSKNKYKVLIKHYARYNKGV